MSTVLKCSGQTESFHPTSRNTDHEDEDEDDDDDEDDGHGYWSGKWTTVHFRQQTLYTVRPRHMHGDRT